MPLNKDNNRALLGMCEQVSAEGRVDGNGGRGGGGQYLQEPGGRRVHHTHRRLLHDPREAWQERLKSGHSEILVLTVISTKALFSMVI